MYKKVCTVLSVFLILCIVSSCKNPAGNCSKFCKYRTNIKDGSNYSNEKGFGEFNKNGSQKICGPFPTGSPWPSFEVHLKVGTTVEKKLCTNNGLPISQEGKTSWFTGDHCVTQDEGKQYKDTPPQFSLKNTSNLQFLVKGKPGMCPGQCVVYRISTNPQYIRYTIDKNQCGINIDIKAFAIKQGSQYACQNCNC